MLSTGEEERKVGRKMRVNTIAKKDASKYTGQAGAIDHVLPASWL